MTAAGAHAALLDALAAADVPTTVGRTVAAGPIVVVPLPEITQLDTACTPPIGTWRFDLTLVGPGAGHRDRLLELIDQLVVLLRTVGAVEGGTPVDSPYLDADVDSYLFTVTIEH